MFSDLPKLFDRDFAIGYFLPVACFLASLYGLLLIFHEQHLVALLAQSNILIGTTTLALITWLIGVFLLSINRKVHQLFSGYPLFEGCEWPDWTKWIEKRRFWGLWEQLDSIKQLEESYVVENKYRKKLTAKRSKIQTTLAERFPEKPSRISPTEFGNIVSAFELYPKVMYGIDAVEGWARLLTVIPKDYRASVDAAKAETDFWLNISFLSTVVLLSYFGFSIYDEKCKALWFPIIASAVSYITYRGAITAAKDWGIMFKSSFDVFLPELYTKLRLSQPFDANAEWSTWNNFSKAIIFRDRSSLPARSQLAEGNKGELPKEEHKSEDKPDDEGKDENTDGREGRDIKESDNAENMADTDGAKEQNRTVIVDEADSTAM